MPPDTDYLDTPLTPVWLKQPHRPLFEQRLPTLATFVLDYETRLLTERIICQSLMLCQEESDRMVRDMNVGGFCSWVADAQHPALVRAVPHHGVEVGAGFGQDHADLRDTELYVHLSKRHLQTPRPDCWRTAPPR